MKPNFSSFAFPENSFGLLAQATCYVEVNEKKIPRINYGKHENAYFRIETQTVKQEKWRENHGHVGTFAVCVSCKRDAKATFTRTRFHL